MNSFTSTPAHPARTSTTKVHQRAFSRAASQAANAIARPRKQVNSSDQARRARAISEIDAARQSMPQTAADAGKARAANTPATANVARLRTSEKWAPKSTAFDPLR